MEVLQVLENISIIDDFKFSYEKKITDIRLKFYGSEEIILNRLSEIEKYLSSGTIKGINVFMWLHFTCHLLS